MPRYCRDCERYSKLTFYQDHCQQLTDLVLAVPYRDSVQPGANSLESAFTALMQSLPRLRCFHASDEFYKYLKPDIVILTLAVLPALEQVSLPAITQNDSFILERLSGDSFPKLGVLYASVPETMIPGLSRRMGSVATLVLLLEGSSKSALRLCAKFGDLTHLEIEFEQDSQATIHGSDLLHLARACCRLRTLTIGAAEDKPLGVNITNKIMDKLASHLKVLGTLSLELDGTKLTEESLISLGKHCRLLQHCDIPAEVDFQELVAAAEPGLFPFLRVLFVYYGSVNDEKESDVQSLAAKFMKLAPKLQSFSILWEDESLDGFVEEVQRLMDAR